MAPYDVASTIRQALWNGVTCGDVNECAAWAYARPLISSNCAGFVTEIVKHPAHRPESA